ncbi:hypothetical protein SNE40_013208 [Patella caerulea]|uniref:Uncharacterized protein n=1 Tax=Patella caerulea TaxID=87958 RepID=A0AAN8JLQ2_PATCE
MFDETLSLLGDSVNFLGHTNLLVVQKRKDFLRLEIRPEFHSLCSPSSFSTPTLLFVEDVVKSMRDLGTAHKMGQRTVTTTGSRSYYSNRRPRFQPYEMNRGRGQRPYYQSPIQL